MDYNKSLTKDLLELKSKVMVQKIDKLYDIYKMLFKDTKCKEINSLEIIKEKYLQMYNTLIEKGEYEKYKEVEDIVIREISKIELNLDRYIYNTIQRCQEIIANNIESIKETENYQNFNNLEDELKKIEILKEVLKLYSSYISKSEIEKMQHEIRVLKFNVLLRRQVEQLIYEGGAKSSNLMRYDNEEEKDCFKELLKEKMRSLTIFEVEDIENDEILRVEPDRILRDGELLERLIIIDMKKNPYHYINLVKAKVFNAHLCNIGNNPFEQEVYLTQEQLGELGWWEYASKKDLKVNKVNFSLLSAVVKSVITDENISIIECENLYNKFGFKCRPILISDEQKCIKMLYDRVKNSQECEQLLEELKNKKSEDGKYCRINFEGLVYQFDNTEENSQENLLTEILSKRKVEKTPETKKRKSHLKKQTITNEEDTLEQKKDKVKEQGILTTDIDIIILLLEETISKYNSEIIGLQEEIKEGDLYLKKIEIEDYEMRIQRYKYIIKELEELKSKNEDLTFQEIKKLLLTISYIYTQLNIRNNAWKILPLECMQIEIDLVPIPTREIYNSWGYYYKTALSSLWKKYQQEFKDLGIDVKKYSGCNERTPSFEICINLDDISDLPIDYKKVKLLSKEELEEIIKREEGNDRE